MLSTAILNHDFLYNSMKLNLRLEQHNRILLQQPDVKLFFTEIVSEEISRFNRIPLKAPNYVFFHSFHS